jgi:glycosyltransferase involved in cell wall biosynthesis
MIKISIITPVLNGEKYIEQTINSVLNQNFSNLEYIIIDGGSTDNTVAIIKKYAENITYWSSESDTGIYDAMNKGVALSTGDIIGIINSDDFYYPEVFFDVANIFNDQKVDVVFGNMRSFNELSGQSIFLKAAFSKLATNMTINHPTCFLRRRCYDAFSFDKKYKLVADYNLMLNLKVNGYTFVHFDKLVAGMRIGGASNNFYVCNRELYIIQSKFFGIYYALYLLVVRYIIKYLKAILHIFLSDKLIEKLSGFSSSKEL